jgi:SAM-dependent methyltransferase
MFRAKDIRRIAKRVLPAPVVSIAKRFYYARVLPLTFRDLSDSDYAAMRDFGISRVPPPSLRFRVHGPVDVASFLDGAKRSVDAITAAFALAGESVPGNGKILDFGCGSGRTLLFWLQMPVPPELYGVDIDGEAIAWARDNVPVKVQQISPRPPLEYPDNFFDVIYSISVFTHLSEDFHRAWLGELLRVVRAGGLVMATVHSQSAIDALPAHFRRKLNDRGFLFYREEAWEHIFPEFYHTAFQTPDYVRREWGSLFDIIGKVCMGHQDLMVMRKHRAGASSDLRIER